METREEPFYWKIEFLETAARIFHGFIDFLVPCIGERAFLLGENCRAKQRQ
jgi:hypothetical protein